MRRACLLLFTGALACGGGADAGGGAQLPGPPDVDPDATPVIAEFSADRATIDLHGYLRISWKVTGARTIEVFDGQSTLASTFDAAGTVIAGPIEGDQTFFLRAVNRDKIATAELSVSVVWPELTLWAFPLADRWTIGQSMLLSWDSTGADEIIIERDGTEIVRRDAIDGRDAQGVDIVAEQQTFKVIAQNPRARREQSINVIGGLPVLLQKLAVRPRVWLGGSQLVNVEWSARNADQLELYYGTADMHVLIASSAAGDGEAEVTIDAPGIFYLSGSNSTSGDTITAQVFVPDEEIEPNDQRAFATAASAGARGAISPGNDVDFYYFANQRFGAPARFLLTGSDGTGCEVDAKITISSEDGTAFTASDGGAASPNGGSCPRLELDQEQLEVVFHDGLGAVVRVESENGDHGRYVLFTEAL